MSRRNLSILTGAQERFCIDYVECGGNGTEAYQRTHPNASHKSSKESASSFLANPDVQARIQEIRNEIAKASKVTVDTLAAELDGAIALAKEDRKASAMVQGIIAKAKLYGLYETKVAHTHVMRPDEARSVIANLLPRYSHLIDQPQPPTVQ